MYGVHVDVCTDHKSLQYVFTQKELNLRQIRWLELLKKLRTTQPHQEGYVLYSPSDFAKESDYERKVKNRFQGPNFGSLVKYKWTYGHR